MSCTLGCLCFLAMRIGLLVHRRRDFAIASQFCIAVAAVPAALSLRQRFAHPEQRGASLRTTPARRVRPRAARDDERLTQATRADPKSEGADPRREAGRGRRDGKQVGRRARQECKEA